MRGMTDQPQDLADAPPWLREAIGLYRSGDPLDMGSEPALYRAMAFVDQHLHVGVPWCGALVAHCLRKTLPDVPVPRGHLRARPWTRWGRATTPRPGAIMTFWRYHPSSPFGHVGFYWDEDADSVHVLGGNQHDRITITPYSKDRVITCRWPESVDGLASDASAGRAAAKPAIDADRFV